MARFSAVTSGLNGYGIVLLDSHRRHAELQFHPMNVERKPIRMEVPDWPYTVTFWQIRLGSNHPCQRPDMKPFDPLGPRLSFGQDSLCS